MKPDELCRRCGSRLDQVLIGDGVDRHPGCHREAGDDLAHLRALRIVAAVFPTAVRILDTRRTP